MVLGLGGWRMLAAAGPASRGVPSQRGPRGVRGARPRSRLHGGRAAALRRRAGRHARRQRLHDAHARRGRLRPVRARSAGEVFRGLRARRAGHCRSAGCSRSAAATADDAAEPFNMAYLAVRGSGAVNGVSRLHGDVSRRIFQPLFPRWPEAEVPVGHVTNGVHVPTWDSAEADRLWERACGKDRWRGPVPDEGHDSSGGAPTRTSGSCERRGARGAHRLHPPATGRGSGPSAGRRPTISPAPTTFFDAGHADDRASPGASRPTSGRTCCCTIPARLVRLLTHPAHPGAARRGRQGAPAGRAPARRSIARVARVRPAGGRRPARGLSERLRHAGWRSTLVQGVDVWINTPRRPWEACGTSGMKVLVNGGLNLSELDGWWAEAYDAGRRLGDRRRPRRGDDPRGTRPRPAALYDRLEREVVPAFYTRDDDADCRAAGWRGCGRAWRA